MHPPSLLNPSGDELISFLDAVKMAARNYAGNSARGELIEG